MKKIIPVIIYILVRSLRATYRYRFIGVENKEKAKSISTSNSYIFSTWHHTIVPAILSQWGLEHYILYSKSKDGDLIKFTADKAGYKSVRGSSKKGGREAAQGLAKALSEGKNGAITPDGPKGPAQVLKKGVVNIAKDSGAAILPLALSIENFHQFNSWDLCKLPLPFSKILVSYGEPVLVPEGDIEESVKIVTQKMNENEVFVNERLNDWKLGSKKP